MTNLTLSTPCSSLRLVAINGTQSAVCYVDAVSAVYSLNLQTGVFGTTALFTPLFINNIACATAVSDTYFMFVNGEFGNAWVAVNTTTGKAVTTTIAAGPYSACALVAQ